MHNKTETTNTRQTKKRWQHDMYSTVGKLRSDLNKSFYK